MTADPIVILYVEDDACTREVFGDLLATSSRRVVAVADGASARRVLRGQHVDLLITDVSLPDGSGVELAREALRQDPALPVILCSGHDTKGIAASLGPTARSLRKPIEVDEIEALIERLTG